MIQLLAAILIGTSWSHQGYSGSIDSRVAELFTEYQGTGKPGASVLVVQNGVVQFEASYGMASLAREEATTPETNYRLASVSKQFTAMAIMILKERGIVSYDDRLTELIEGFPSYGRRIKLRHLLNHTSGLRKYEEHIPSGQSAQLSDRDVVNILKRLRSTYFTPGSRYRYSNSGYAALAIIVEEKSGMSFPEFLEQNIFTPLQMNQSVAFVNGVNEVENRAYGHSRRRGRFIETDQSRTSAVLGDGGVYTSLRDFFKWDQGLWNHSLVSEETLNEAFTRGRLSGGQRISYGFGWRLDSYRGKRRVYHTGSTIGFRNIGLQIPEERFSVVVLINRNEGQARRIAERITDLYLF